MDSNTSARPVSVGVREAARQLMINPGDIRRLVARGVLKDNGRTGYDRRISQWSLDRAKKRVKPSPKYLRRLNRDW